jgi:hypothetical protein
VKLCTGEINMGKVVVVVEEDKANIKLLFLKAIPEPDFKYFSKLKALSPL